METSVSKEESNQDVTRNKLTPYIVLIYTLALQSTPNSFGQRLPRLPWAFAETLPPELLPHMEPVLWIGPYYF